jgi:hypothetical protein
VRIFFVLLLLANIGFFAWQYQARGGLADRDIALDDFQPTDPGVTPLVLLSERSAPPAAVPAPAAGAEALPLAATGPGEPVTLQEEAAETGPPAEIAETEQIIVAAPETDAEHRPAPGGPPEPASQAPPAAARHCLELGPATDRGAIEQAAAAARQAGARTTIRESGQAGAGGYSVRLPEFFFSLPEARARYRELQQKGVDDIAIVPLPDKRYFISLGVYKRKDTVEERRKEILAKGVTPVIEDRAQTLYTLAFEFETADPAPLQALQRTLSAQAPQIKLQEVACQ